MEHSRRLAALTERMREERLDLVLLFDRDNVRYFTGFRLNRAVSSILAVSPDEGPTYLVAQLDLERAKRDCFIKCVVPFPEDTPNYLRALAQLFRIAPRRIGVEKDALTLRQAEYLRELGQREPEFVDIRGLTSDLRAIKSPEEIAAIRRAAAIADRVMGRIRAEVRPGAREADLASLTEHLAVQEGAEGNSFEPFLMSGKNAWLPQRVASRKTLEEGELALFDMGVVYEGYCSDLTRTFAVGEVSDERRRLFDVALAAQRAAMEALQPGVAAGDVDRAARAVIEEAGLGQYFPHITGHGLGVSTHEAPILDRGREDPLRPGMVLTVEPGVYVPGVGAARVEDMVLVTPAGHEVLTAAPRALDGKE